MCLDEKKTTFNVSIWAVLIYIHDIKLTVT